MYDSLFHAYTRVERGSQVYHWKLTISHGHKLLRSLSSLCIWSVISTYYLRSSSAGKIVESFIDAPARIPSGEIVSLTFNVVNKKADINTPIANLNYTFRVTPGADKVYITPSEAITDDNGNIYLSLNSQSGYKGEIVIWVLSEKHNLEKPRLHLHIGETK